MHRICHFASHTIAQGSRSSSAEVLSQMKRSHRIREFPVNDARRSLALLREWASDAAHISTPNASRTTATREHKKVEAAARGGRTGRCSKRVRAARGGVESLP